MKRTKAVRWITAASALGAFLSLGTIFTTTNAYAGTGTGCSGHGCDGLDPTQSYNSATGKECSSGAADVADLPNGVAALGGHLELRWGPNCSTNWARFTPGDNDLYALWVVNISAGEWAGTGIDNDYVFSNARGITEYTDQLYVPGAAGVCIEDLTANDASYCYYQQS
jgi:hypothetical protein